jgi:integrase
MIEAVVANLNDRYSRRNHKPSDHRYEALAWTAALSGLRGGELFALERQDVDLLHRTLSVTKQAQNVGKQRVVGPPKSAAGSRVVVIPTRLAAMLDLHLATYVGPRPDALVFTSDEGLPMHRARWAFVWRRATAAAGLEGLHFHDLRHHGGTLAAQLGATTKELMERLGHSTMRASLIYQHSTQQRERELADRMDAVLDRHSTGADMPPQVVPARPRPAGATADGQPRPGGLP